MKKIISILIILLVPCIGIAQKVQYKTFIYTNDDLANEISQKHEENCTTLSRGNYMGNLLTAGLNAGKGIASGYVTSFIDMGISAVGSLLTKNAKQKEEWEKTVKNENVFETQINTVSEINDFYKEISFDGAMDPKGMRFDGIGCLRMEGKDTVFYISCHIDRTKIHRIINHSKFEMVLDTFIISPVHSNLPNSPLKMPYSFEERKDFRFSIKIQLISSWMNEIVQLQKDQLLGEFNITIPVQPNNLDAKGFFRYVRNEQKPNPYRIVGESFIVPRSYMGYRDDVDEYKDCWGTGEYKLAITLKETCDVTEEYRSNWKKDRKQREKMSKKDNIFTSTWQTISSQNWDEYAQSWVITTLKAPASIITTDLIEELGLKVTTSPTSATATGRTPTTSLTSAPNSGQHAATTKPQTAQQSTGKRPPIP